MPLKSFDGKGENLVFTPMSMMFCCLGRTRGAITARHCILLNVSDIRFCNYQ